jgi:aminoglycoside/choline kinase family phosphotransferase
MLRVPVVVVVVVVLRKDTKREASWAAAINKVKIFIQFIKLKQQHVDGKPKNRAGWPRTLQLLNPALPVHAAALAPGKGSHFSAGVC